MTLFDLLSLIAFIDQQIVIYIENHYPPAISYSGMLKDYRINNKQLRYTVTRISITDDTLCIYISELG